MCKSMRKLLGANASIIAILRYHVYEPFRPATVQGFGGGKTFSGEGTFQVAESLFRGQIAKLLKANLKLSAGQLIEN